MASDSEAKPLLAGGENVPQPAVEESDNPSVSSMFNLGPGQLSRNLSVLAQPDLEVQHKERGVRCPGAARRGVKQQAGAVKKAIQDLVGSSPTALQLHQLFKSWPQGFGQSR